MPYIRIIPSLLFADGRLVKGVRFADWRDAGSPASTIRAHNAQKADELILLDIMATREGRGPAAALLEPIALEAELPLVVGGGIRSLEDAAGCFAAGADKVALGAALRRRPELAGEIAERYGSQAIVACLDVVREGGGYRLYDYLSGTALEQDWLAHARRLVEAGVGEFRLMRVDREGMRESLDAEAWHALRAAVPVPIILEGGAADLTSVLDAVSAGVDSVGLGTMLVFSDNNIIQIKRHLKNAGAHVRP